MDSLGDRMKAYEASWSTILPPVQPIVVRIDGKAFHSFTRRHNFKKPFSDRLRERMIEAAYRVASDMMNFKAAYIQSDEITLVMVLDRFESQHWFGGNKQKIESVSASLATAGFNHYMTQGDPATFDARAFSLPFHEVLNNILWRMQDCERNAIQMIARAHFSHRELEGANQQQMLHMLVTQHGIHISTYPEKFILGTLLGSGGEEIGFFPRINENRVWWEGLIFGECVYYDGG